MPDEADTPLDEWWRGCLLLGGVALACGEASAPDESDAADEAAATAGSACVTIGEMRLAIGGRGVGCSIVYVAAFVVGTICGAPTPKLPGMAPCGSGPMTPGAGPNRYACEAGIIMRPEGPAPIALAAFAIWLAPANEPQAPEAEGMKACGRERSAFDYSVLFLVSKLKTEDLSKTEMRIRQVCESLQNECRPVSASQRV